jgi:hypothetical protein
MRVILISEITAHVHVHKALYLIALPCTVFELNCVRAEHVLCHCTCIPIRIRKYMQSAGVHGNAMFSRVLDLHLCMHSTS